MQFDSQTSQFISTNFFEEKATDDESYKSVVRIFDATIVFPFAAFLVVSYLVFIYSSRIVTYAEGYIKGDVENESQSSSATTNENVENESQSNSETAPSLLKLFKESRLITFINSKIDKIKCTCCTAAAGINHDNGYEIIGSPIRDKQEVDRKIRIFSLSLASIFLTLTLLAFHVMASMRVIEYGNEVLYDKDDNRNSNGATDSSNGIVTEHSGNDDQCLPIIYVVFSYLPTVSLIIVLLASLILIACNEKELSLFLQVSLGLCLVYLGFYFLPYMLLAFINDPIKTIFIYTMEALFILCIFLLIYSLCFSINESRQNIFLIFPFTIIWYQLRHPYLMGSGASIAYFLIILIFLLRLGNFNDFQAAHNLTLPIAVIILSVFVLKPLFKYIFKPSSKEDVDDVTKLIQKVQQLIEKTDSRHTTQPNNPQDGAHNTTLQSP